MPINGHPEWRAAVIEQLNMDLPIILRTVSCGRRCRIREQARRRHDKMMAGQGRDLGDENMRNIEKKLLL
jgi:hypothetical protein